MTKRRQQFGHGRGDAPEFGAIPGPRLLRTNYAAKFLGLSEWKLRRLIQEGQIPVVQYGDRAPWLVDIRDLEKWIIEKKQIIPL